MTWIARAYTAICCKAAFVLVARQGFLVEAQAVADGSLPPAAGTADPSRIVQAAAVAGFSLADNRLW